MSTVMQTIDEKRLENDTPYRFGYLTEFMGFGPDDVAAIRAVAPGLLPLVPGLVAAVYVKLFNYDATKRHFVPHQAGYEGQDAVDLQSLTPEHDVIKFRKAHLARYLQKVFAGEYDAKTPGYLDFVGKIHTSKAGNKAVEVPLVQMGALMGFVADALITNVFGLGEEPELKTRAVRAFNKLLWLQYDLIARHFVN